MILRRFKFLSSKSYSSSGKSPTLTCAGFTNPPYFGKHSKYLLPLTLKREVLKINNGVYKNTRQRTINSVLTFHRFYQVVRHTSHQSTSLP